MFYSIYEGAVNSIVINYFVIVKNYAPFYMQLRYFIYNKTIFSKFNINSDAAFVVSDMFSLWLWA